MDGKMISQLRILAMKSDEYAHGQLEHWTFPCIIPEFFILFSRQRLFIFSALQTPLYSFTTGHPLLEAGPYTSGQ